MASVRILLGFNNILILLIPVNFATAVFIFTFDDTLYRIMNSRLSIFRNLICEEKEIIKDSCDSSGVFKGPLFIEMAMRNLATVISKGGQKIK